MSERRDPTSDAREDGKSNSPASSEMMRSDLSGDTRLPAAADEPRVGRLVYLQRLCDSLFRMEER